MSVTDELLANNERYAEDNESFGLTTLRPDHVEVTRRHVVGDPAYRAMPQRDAADGDVTIGQHALQPHARHVVDDGDNADIEIPHDFRSTRDGSVGGHDRRIGGHDVSGFHGILHRNVDVARCATAAKLSVRAWECLRT